MGPVWTALKGKQAMIFRRTFLAAAMILALQITGPTSAQAQNTAPKPAQNDLSEAALVGIWQFETPLCQSGYGMGLYADGTAWLDEVYGGTWQLDGRQLRFEVDETELGEEDPIETGIVMIADIVTYETDVMLLRWMGSGHEIQAYRCPAP